MKLDDLHLRCQAYIIDKSLVQDHNKKIIDQDKNLKFVLLHKQYSQKIYTWHLLRSQAQDIYQLLENMVLKNQGSKEEYTFVGSDFSLEKLFPYQQELLKLIFLNEEFVRQLMNAYFIQNTSSEAKNIVSLLLFFLLKLIVDKDYSRTLNEQEKNKLKKFRKYYLFAI
ncbi:hypothetical protein ABPG74_019938 [Tetrahymena malaccensis]